MDATDQTFDDVVLARSHERPVVVDFWAEWCGPCHALAPVLEGAVAERGGAVELVKVDVDANTERWPASSASAGSRRSRRSGTAASCGSSWARSRRRRSPRFSTRFSRRRARMRSSRSCGRRGELPDVLAALDAGDTERALELLVEAVPSAGPGREGASSRSRGRALRAARAGRPARNELPPAPRDRALLSGDSTLSTCSRLSGDDDDDRRVARLPALDLDDRDRGVGGRVDPRYVALQLGCGSLGRGRRVGSRSSRRPAEASRRCSGTHRPRRAGARSRSSPA